MRLSWSIEPREEKTHLKIMNLFNLAIIKILNTYTIIYQNPIIMNFKILSNFLANIYRKRGIRTQ